jgi:hypothetical protein
MQAPCGSPPASDDFEQKGKQMSRCRSKGRLALMVATMMYALTGCASVGRDVDTRATGDQRAPSDQSVRGAVAGHLDGWPEAVLLPEGVQIDGYRCSNRYCTIWFGLMDLDQVMALKRNYVKLLKDSEKWEQLGTPGNAYEHEAFRYTGAMPSGCGYTLEIRQGAIPNDYYRRYRVFASLTW